ncbi:FtsW/RodA/SpoVE family cell cycle protein [Streptomyces sp. SID13666]|uniref:FtsW/RodA/SpoVE family cell cycle protein n=1 Tax=Streptomyces TaxID=1883 RepID=UPI0011068528|nr:MULTISPECIES: FtsW/RodA/SpoVE family cell cycle protein [Streptomyces]MCM2420452.1 FtsW/RodA/SpoVE family cell cycle protein [Streptomyces sp. RKAG293]MCM2427329.1 FtsW/RodA/SpoVE family cell cycle protein [Streptomyces sp. RKAG337]MCZ4094838.1 FtsW/RodA/SpoVE family cell cycle protein [Streptomyces sp. H39-C1]NEA57680.1 FtsW/RodA/SpoVE family cell cycle protein [Streptomyces sp. SID13666]NEA74022.1 FtsW/RodA/SpoVE family cell cycle protein [Streptomyces sp. SID13588]
MSASNTSTISSVGAPSRRNTELALLVFAVLIPVFAYANVGLAKDGSLPAGLLAYGLGLGLLAGIAHLIVRKFAPYADPLMLPIATLLNGMGLVFIWRLDLEPSLGKAMAPTQLMWSTLGVALFVAVLVVLKDHRILQRYTYISMVVALVLLIMPVFFPGINGAKIWVTIPGVGSLQPGEFAKIIITVFFAGYLMVKRDALALASRRFMGLYLPRGRDLGPILVLWVLSLLILVFETDLGTSLLFFGLFVIMLYVATERTSWIVFGLVLSAAGAVFVSTFEHHVKDRVDNWLNPLALVNGGVTETAQTMYAFGSGGMFGSGLGQGYSRLIGGIAPKSDYILATVGEELGLAGLMGVLLLYGLLIERGVRTALAARDPFGKLLAIGLSGAFALQVFVVAGGVTGLIPLTGMTMPFLAQGGSSVIANWALVAILLRISDTARRPAPSPAPSTDAEPTQVVRTQ